MKGRLAPFWVAGLLLLIGIVGGHLSLVRFNQTSPGSNEQFTARFDSLAPTDPESIETANITPVLEANSARSGWTSLHPTPGLEAVLRMIQSGVAEGTLLAFVTNSELTFHLRPDHIIYLNKLEVPSKVVMAMIRHDSELAASSFPEEPPLISPEMPSPEFQVPRDEPVLANSASASSSSANSIAGFESWLMLAPRTTAPATPQQPAASSPTLANTPLPGKLVTSRPIIAAPPLPPNFPVAAVQPITQSQSREPAGVTEPEQERSEPIKHYPVRQPFAVKLTDPIFLVRAESRIANVQFIAPLH